MRFNLLLVPALFALTPFYINALEHDHHDHAGSLSAHVHGIATLNIALEDQRLELQLSSPAMNLVGFEYKPTSATDKQSVLDAERSLKNEQALFKLTEDAQCALSAISIDNDLTEHADEHDHTAHADDKDEHPHSDIQVNYQFNCAAPSKLSGIDLAGFFKSFPLTEKVRIQLITADTQLGIELSHSDTSLSW